MQHTPSVTTETFTSHPAQRHALIFWAGLALILLLAAIPRLIVFDYGMPYLEYIDEVQLYHYGQAARGLSSTKATNLTSYPPAFVQFQVVTQSLMESMGRSGPTPAIHTLRLAAVIANLAGIALIAGAARMVGGDLAGLVAAGLWAVSPLVVEWSVLAIGESFVYPLMALYVFMLCGSVLRADRWRWALASVLVAIAINLFEYRLVLLLIPGPLILLWRFGQRRSFDRASWLRLMLIAGVGAILVAALSLLVLPARYQRWLQRAFAEDLWDIPLLLAHFQVMLETFYLPGILLLGGLGLVGWWRVRRSGPHNVLIVLLLALAVGINWLATGVRWPSDTGVRIQNVLPAALIIGVLGGVAAGWFLRAVRPRWLAVGMLLAVLGLTAFAQVPALAGLINNLDTQNWQVVIRQWADTNLKPGTIIVYGEHERTFNPLWGGIQGRHWFDWWPTGDILEYPLDEWVNQRGMSYALVPIAQQRILEQSAEGQALISHMLRLRDFVHPPVRREPEGIFYRLWRMQHETEIHFGEHIQLSGYDQSAETVQPGDTVDFTFYWHAPTTPEDNYSLFIHLAPPDAYTVLAQADGAPAVPERPTLTWDEPSETLISPTFTLTMPTDLEPGSYRVMIGLYDFATGTRLPIADAGGAPLGDAYLLTELTVAG